MKLFTAIAAACLCVSAAAQVQIGKSVQIGGTGTAAVTALTGDVSATGPGTASSTLATVNSAVGTCGDATHVPQVTLDAKGRATGCTPIAITGGGGGTPPSGPAQSVQLANSGVTGLNSDPNILVNTSTHQYQITGLGSQFIGATNPSTGYAATWSNTYNTKLNSPSDFIRNPYFGGPGGYNYGNGPGVTSNWTTGSLNYWNPVFARRGITQFISASVNKRATGDYAGIYFNRVMGVGGITGTSDEGGVGRKIIGGELSDTYTGTATAGAATGITTLPVTAGVQTCDGCFVYDASRPGPSGHFTGAAAFVTVGTAGYWSEPIDTPVTPSTAYGVPVCTLPQLTDQTVPQTVACTVTGALGSTGVFVNGIASLSGPYAEQVSITVSAPSGGSQTVNITYRNPHVSGQFMLWQGGTAQGMLQSLGAYTTVAGGRPNGETVFGAPDANHLAAGIAFGGSVIAPDTNYSATVNILAPITKSGSIATGVIDNTVAANYVPFANLASATIAGVTGCTGGSVNGTATAITVNFQAATISWTDASASTGCTGGGTIQQPTSNFAYQLYPYAEQIAAGDVSTQMILEPNIMPVAPGDNLVQPHPPTFGYNATWDDTKIYNPNSHASNNGYVHSYAGAGINSSFFPFRISNVNPCGMYQGCGGSQSLNPWLQLEGPNWGTIFSTIPINPLNYALTFNCPLGYNSSPGTTGVCTDKENVLSMPLGQITLDNVNGWKFWGPGLSTSGFGSFGGALSAPSYTGGHVTVTNLNSDTNPPLTLQEQYVGDNFCRGEYFVQQVGQPWGHICAYHFADGGDAYGLGFEVGWNLTRALTLTLDQGAPRAIFPGLVSITGSGSLTTPSASVLASSTSGDLAKFDNTTGHLADSGVGASSVALLGVSNTWTAAQTFPAVTATGTATAAKFQGTGANPSIATGTASNTDVAGQVTLAAGTATQNFSGTYTSAPICVASDTTAANAVKVSATTTVLTLTGTTTDVINYVCIGRN